MEEQETIAKIAAILWPGENPEEPWTPDTLDQIATVMILAGYGPKD